jgi:hypothetical protein
LRTRGSFSRPPICSRGSSSLRPDVW